MFSYAIRDRLLRFASQHRGAPLELVSYDVSGHDNRTAVAICHFLFGHVTRGSNGHGKEYRYPGFVEREGVVWVGQSVFLVTPLRSEELRTFLASKVVAHGRVHIRTT